MGRYSLWIYLQILFLVAIFAEKERVEEQQIAQITDKLFHVLEKRINEWDLDENDALEDCSFQFSNESIIRTRDSIEAGATFIKSPVVQSRESCQEICCDIANCNLAVYKDKVNENACYLFDCGTPSVCQFTGHPGFIAMEMPSRQTTNKQQAKHEKALESLAATTESTSTTSEPTTITTSTTTESTTTTSTTTTQSPVTEPDETKPVPLFGECESHKDCAGSSTECLAGYCVCQEGYHAQDGICRKECSRFEFECQNEGQPLIYPQCIAIYDKCDGIMHCKDGSDEKHCNEGVISGQLKTNKQGENDMPSSAVQNSYPGLENDIQGPYPGPNSNIQGPYPGSENVAQGPYPGSDNVAQGLYPGSDNTVQGPYPGASYAGKQNNYPQTAYSNNPLMQQPQQQQFPQLPVSNQKQPVGIYPQQNQQPVIQPALQPHLPQQPNLQQQYQLPQQQQQAVNHQVDQRPPPPASHPVNHPQKPPTRLGPKPVAGNPDVPLQRNHRPLDMNDYREPERKPKPAETHKTDAAKHKTVYHTTTTTTTTEKQTKPSIPGKMETNSQKEKQDQSTNWKYTDSQKVDAVQPPYNGRNDYLNSYVPGYNNNRNTYVSDGTYKNNKQQGQRLNNNPDRNGYYGGYNTNANTNYNYGRLNSGYGRSGTYLSSLYNNNNNNNNNGVMGSSLNNYNGLDYEPYYVENQGLSPLSSSSSSLSSSNAAYPNYEYYSDGPGYPGYFGYLSNQIRKPTFMTWKQNKPSWREQDKENGEESSESEEANSADKSEEGSKEKLTDDQQNEQGTVGSSLTKALDSESSSNEKTDDTNNVKNIKLTVKSTVSPVEQKHESVKENIDDKDKNSDESSASDDGKDSDKQEVDIQQQQQDQIPQKKDESLVTVEKQPKTNVIPQLPMAPADDDEDDIAENGQSIEVDEVEETAIYISTSQKNRGAVIALALGLAVTALLLLFVGCRLRNMKRRLRKGRPMNSNEADYLINGMYL